MSAAQTPVSQLLERNLSAFAGKRLLVAGYLEDNYPLTLVKQASSWHLFTTDYGRWHQLSAAAASSQHAQISYSHQLTGEHPAFDALLLLLPKAKAETQYLLANLLPHLKTGGEIFLAGDNRGGINGADKLLAPYCEQSQKIDSARRCSLVHGQLQHPVTAFELDTWLQRYPLVLGHQQLTVLALPGVFSADGLDEGTQLLLEHLPPLHGRVLDVAAAPASSARPWPCCALSSKSRCATSMHWRWSPPAAPWPPMDCRPASTHRTCSRMLPGLCST